MYEGRPLYKTSQAAPTEPVNPQGKSEREKKSRPFTAEERLKRKEEARRRHAERQAKELKYEELKFERFKQTFKYKFVGYYAAFSLMLGALLLLDMFLPTKQEVAIIEGLEVATQQRGSEMVLSAFYLDVCHQQMEVGYYTYQYLSGETHVVVEYSALAKNLEAIYVPSAQGMERIENDKVQLLPFMFLLTLLIFLAEGPSYAYYRIIEMTGLISLIALILLIVDGNGLLRLIGIYGC